MLNRYLALVFVILFVSAAYAEADNVVIPSAKWPELSLVTEFVVDNISEGNLSGLAVCNKELWAISDRSDLKLYKLVKQTNKSLLVAEIELFEPPAVPENTVPLWESITTLGIGIVRGGAYDYEGITCDAFGNRYIVSEAYLTVLKIPKQGPLVWLPLPNELWTQAKEQGLLLKTNQTLEGIAVSPDGKRLWLAAERNNRGILTAVFYDKEGWRCPNQQCVLLVEKGKEVFPKQFRRKNRVDLRDFSDLSFYKDKLFTLERGTFRICRRNLSAQVEQCWSIAKEALQPHRQYKSYGMPEALWIDETGAWVGVDNDMGNKRIDGEARPIIWYFKSPTNGWLATEGLSND